MAVESLRKTGLYFDDLNKIRVLDPDASQKTSLLKDECKEYVNKITEFQTVVDGFLQIANALSAEVEKEKLKAIGSRNLLKSITKQREAQQQQLQALIIEKKLQLERVGLSVYPTAEVITPEKLTMEEVITPDKGTVDEVHAPTAEVINSPAMEESEEENSVAEGIPFHVSMTEGTSFDPPLDEVMTTPEKQPMDEEAVMTPDEETMSESVSFEDASMPEAPEPKKGTIEKRNMAKVMAFHSYSREAATGAEATATLERGKKVNSLTLKDKIQVIKLREQNHSVKDLCQMFNCGKTQIYEAIRKKVELLKEYEEGGANRKRKRAVENDDIDKITLEWYWNTQAKNLPVTGPLLRERAKEIAEKLGKNDFKASNGWLTSFLNRHNISMRHHPSSESKNSTPEEKADWTERIPSLMADYEPRDVFSCAETGLFYRGIPSKSIYEGSISGRLSKERLSVLLCCNMSGDIEKPLVIGKEEEPQCFKSIDASMLPVTWKSQKNAQLTNALMQDWLKSFNNKMVEENRMVLLVWNSAPSHSDIELSNVKLVFLPSKRQPLDLGMIKMLKILYKKYFLRSLIARFDTSTPTPEQIRTISILDAVKWIGRACSDMAKSPEKITRCFQKAGFTVNNNDTKIGDDNSVDQKQNEAELQALMNAASYLVGSEIIDAADYVSVDDDISALESNISIDDIIQQHKALEAENIEDSAEEEDMINSYQEALKYIKCLESFFLRQNNKELMPILTELQCGTERQAVNELLHYFSQQ